MPETVSSLHRPQRQSPAAILMILLKHLRIIVRQIWPLLLILAINRKSSRGMLIIAITGGVAFISLIYSIWAYTRYYFFIENNELCVRSGVFRRKKLNVPFDRIQSVDFKQNVVHQLLNVVSVQVDTAGSKGSELELDAIDPKRAHELRETVMAYKRSQATALHAISTAEEEAGGIAPVEIQEPPELILSLSPYDLIKVGISENHLRTAAIIFAFFIGLADDLDQIMGWDIYGGIEETTTSMSLFGIIATLIAIPFFIMVSFLFTLVRTMLKYYGLKFWRAGQSFKVVSGLLTRNEKTIQKSKIQVIRWITSPLKKLFGIYQMNIYQATPDEQQQNKSLVIPGCYRQQVDHTLDVIVPAFREAVFSTHRMHPRIVYLMVFLFGFLPALLFGILAWLNDGVLQWLLVLVFPLAVWMGILYQKKRRLRIHPDFILSEGGIFGDTCKLIEIFKVQTVEITSSPLQRRKGLATLHVYTAGGDITFPYLSEATARQARDYVLYRAEVEQRSWM